MQDPNNQPLTPTPTPTLRDRIQAEAIRRAKEIAENFDLREAAHLNYLRFDDDADEKLVTVHGKHVSRGTLAVSLDELTEAVRSFLVKHLPGIIEDKLRDDVLSSESADVDVTKLKS